MAKEDYSVFYVVPSDIRILETKATETKEASTFASVTLPKGTVMNGEDYSGWSFTCAEWSAIPESGYISLPNTNKKTGEPWTMNLRKPITSLNSETGKNEIIDFKSAKVTSAELAGAVKEAMAERDKHFDIMRVPRKVNDKEMATKLTGKDGKVDLMRIELPEDAKLTLADGQEIEVGNYSLLTEVWRVVLYKDLVRVNFPKANKDGDPWTVELRGPNKEELSFTGAELAEGSQKWRKDIGSASGTRAAERELRQEEARERTRQAERGIVVNDFETMPMVADPTFAPARPKESEQTVSQAVESCVQQARIASAKEVNPTKACDRGL